MNYERMTAQEAAKKYGLTQEEMDRIDCSPKPKEKYVPERDDSWESAFTDEEWGIIAIQQDWC